jgi:hypothetical protein
LSRGRGGECWLRCDAMFGSRQVLSGERVSKNFEQVLGVNLPSQSFETFWQMAPRPIETKLRAGEVWACSYS